MYGLKRPCGTTFTIRSNQRRRMSSHCLQKHSALAAAGEPPDRLPAEAERLLQLVVHLSTTSRTLRKRLAELASQGDLSEHELLVVWLCVSTGRVQSELAATVGVSPAQMSGLVERLRARGLVELQRMPQDRRRHVWRTSAHGRQVLARTVPHLQKLARDLMHRLSDEEQRMLLTLCQQLASACGHTSGSAPTPFAAVVVPCSPPHAA